MDASLSAQPSVAVQREVSDSKLKEDKLYQHDLVLVLLRDKWLLNNVACTVFLAVGVLMCTALVLLGLAALSGVRFDFGNNLGNTIRAMLQIFIFPLLTTIYFLLPTGITNYFNTLQCNGVIGTHRSGDDSLMTYDSFLGKYISWVDSFWWPVAAFVLVVLFWLYRFLIMAPSMAPSIALSTDQNHPSFWLQIALQLVTLVLYSPLLYCAFLSVVRLLITLIFTNWLFHTFTIKINPLHPDGFAGLGVIGSMLSYSTILMVAMAVAGLAMNGSFLLDNQLAFSLTEAILLGLGYLVLAPILLVGWLIVPHTVMSDALNETLRPLADEFQRAIMDTKPGADEDAATIKAGTDRLAELKRRYDLIQETYPTWPMTVQTIRRMIATISIPALITLLLPLLTGAFTYLVHAFGGR